MKKAIVFFFVLFFSLTVTAQHFKYYFDNNLHFKDQNGVAIPYPFTGGFISPQFSNIDLNDDGKKDLFVFDRSTDKVLTFINNGIPGAPDWVYAPQYESAFPTLKYWVLLADYNCDGKADIFTAAWQDTLYTNISVYTNTSTGGKLQFALAEWSLNAIYYSDTLPRYSINIQTGDVPAFTDIDGDGDLDILAYDNQGVYPVMYRNNRVEKGLPCTSLVFQFVDDCWGSFSVDKGPTDLHLGRDCWRNGGRYYKSSGDLGATVLLLDIDKDGDRDMLLSHPLYNHVNLLTNGKIERGWEYDTIVSFDTMFPRSSKRLDVNSFPGLYYVDVDDDGKRDLLSAPNIKNGGKNINQIWYYHNNGDDNAPVFLYVQDNFLQDKTLDLGSGASTAAVDIDNDGDLDLIVANRNDYEITKNSADRLTLFENTGNKNNPVFTLKNYDFIFLAADSIRDAKPAFGDLNGDGKTDLLIGDQDGVLHYYAGTGPGTFAPRIKNYLGVDIGFAAAPQIIDLDGDSLKDIIIGTGNGFINFYKNKGSKTAPLFDTVATLDSMGGVRTTYFYWKPIAWDSHGNVTDSSKEYSNPFSGYATPYFTDLDENGKLDLLLGGDLGKLWLFKDITNPYATFTEEPNFFYNNFKNAFGGVNLGSRIAPIGAKLYDTLKPVILAGNFRGGVNFMKADTGVTLGIDPRVALTFNKLNISLFPNPAAENVTLQRDREQNSENLFITITDMLGREAETITWADAGVRLQLPLGGYKSGIYYITITDGKKYSTVEKLSVVH